MAPPWLSGSGWKSSAGEAPSGFSWPLELSLSLLPSPSASRLPGSSSVCQLLNISVCLPARPGKRLIGPSSASQLTHSALVHLSVPLLPLSTSPSLAGLTPTNSSIFNNPVQVPPSRTQKPVHCPLCPITSWHSPSHTSWSQHYHTASAHSHTHAGSHSLPHAGPGAE